MHLPQLKDSLSTVLVGICYFSSFKLDLLKVQQVAFIWCNLLYRLPFHTGNETIRLFFVRGFFLSVKTCHLQWNVRNRSTVPSWVYLKPKTQEGRIQQSWVNAHKHLQEEQTSSKWLKSRIWLWSHYSDKKMILIYKTNTFNFLIRILSCNLEQIESVSII